MANLNNTDKFFQEVYLKFAEYLASVGDKRLLILLKKQKENRDILLQEVSNILLDYNIKDDLLNLTDSEKIKIYSSIGDKIDKATKEEFDIEKDTIKSTLIDIGLDKYNSTSFIFNTMFSTGLKKCSKATVNKLINRKIDGKLFSDRLYDNKKEVAKRLKQVINDLTEGKITVNDIKDNLINTYNINAYESKRLLNDNINRVNEGINETWQKDNNIEYVMYCATLEANTCSECGRYDGQVYKVNEKPVNLPQHPFCRCTYIALPSKGYKPSTRLDNSTKKNIKWQTYHQWKEDNGLD